MENIEEKVHVLELKDSGLQRFAYDFCCAKSISSLKIHILNDAFLYRFSLGPSTRAVKLMSGRLG